MKRLTEAVLADPANAWGKETKKQAEIDANALLEVLLLEYGVEVALKALVKHGYSPDGKYRYVAEPLYRMAIERRSRRLVKKGTLSP